MSDNDKTWIFISTQNHRLDELLALFGCTNEIAPFDADALAKRSGKLICLTACAKEAKVPTDYYATGYLERDAKPHAGSSYKRIKDGLLQELVNYVMERSSDQRGLYRITVGENVYTGPEIEKLYDQSDFPRG